MFKPQTKSEWAFLGTTATQAGVNTAIQLYVLDRYLRWVNPNVYQVARSYTIPVTFAIFVFGVVYQFLLAWDSLRSKNNIQLFAQAVCNVCLFISAVLQYEQVKDVVHGLPPNHDAQNKPLVKLDVNIWAQIHPALIAFIAVFAACSVAMCGLAYKLHKQFAWALYKDINADTSLRTRYLIYQVFLVLMKLSFYFLVSFVIIYGFVDVHYEQPEFALTMAIIPVAMLQILLSAFAARHENRFFMLISILVYAGGVAYLVSRIILLVGDGPRSKTIMKDEMMFFAVVSLILTASTLVASTWCMINFGHGLKPHLLGMTAKKAPQDPEDAYRFERLSHTAPPPEFLTPRRFALD
ncbi:hypothetical protein BFW01_g1419 [Lasiodiplodia theobromae]|uniref:Uncharacterized protein n=1 Tax=Lasiodiplodia theobromae TaxID=45133 RepID=A0A5N5D8K3_9PEZI|nr:uncharacterized protein LTHEOB_2016 [Lasiodiplodia theobromae]KAB2574088.1 hypothetical protein DBV05_g7241 [Lasiodiplodia theobromae]KAF4536255.1 hypothetical protein LTHEOB_2016 [Lasiodiplodia theobromae]KAF9630857.1 hypothetical protein BFW01_g1419 [Lasiodiplodia theobromae]